MKWFFAISSVSQSLTQEHKSLKGSSEEYFKLAKVAVYSAKQNTSLELFCIYDGEENEFTVWLREQGVNIIFHRTPHYEDLKALGSEVLKIGSGAFLRVEIPKILEINKIPDHYVLYTDVDVMFMKDVDKYLDSRTCDYFAVAPEPLNVTKKNESAVNTGVMLMNTKNLLEVYEPFNKFIIDNLHEFVGKGYDQRAYQKYFSGKWDILDHSMNWRPYWYSNSEAQILHFHGAKPNQIETNISHIKKVPLSRFTNMVNHDYLKYAEIWQESYKKIINEELEKKKQELKVLESSHSMVNQLLTRKVAEVQDIVKLTSKESKLLSGFNIESPAKKAIVVTDFLRIKGWVVGKESPAVKVEFLCNGEVIGTTPVNQQRPDVAKIHPQGELAKKSGFSATVEMKEVKSEFEILVQVILEDGSCIEMAKILCSQYRD